MNAQSVHSKVTSDSGRAAALASGDRSSAGIIENLYLLVYSRPPRAEEKQAAVAFLDRDPAKRRKSVEDLMWAMLNTPEFIFKH